MNLFFKLVGLLALLFFIACYPKYYVVKFSHEENISDRYKKSYFHDSIQLYIDASASKLAGNLVDLILHIKYDDTLADRLTIDLEKARIQYNKTILSSEDYHKNPYPIKTDTSFHDQLLFGKKIKKMEYELDENMVYIFLSEAVLLDNKEFIKEKIVGTVKE